MLNDPLMKWECGMFPYEALTCAEVTPETNMDALKDVPYQLIERGLWTAEAREAWEQLRTFEKRLWVDWLTYPETPEEIVRCFDELWAKHAVEIEIGELLSGELSDLEILIDQLRSGSYVPD
jgi:hypothetical protein